MNKLVKEIVFINYCGQKIGQFNTSNIKISLANAIASPLSMILYIPLVFVFILLGQRSFIFMFGLMIVLAMTTRYVVKNKLISSVEFTDLEKRYQNTSKAKRRWYFILSMVFVAGSVLLFVLSFFLIKHIK